MKPNTKAMARRRPPPCILIFMAALASLASGACASHNGRAPAADGPLPALREAISPEHLAKVALMDSQTPFPATAGRAALFVDGDFYAHAAEAVKAYVLEQLREGIPVAFFGDQAGYEALRSSVGAAADLPAEPVPERGGEEFESSGPANPAAAVRGLKVYPSPNPNEPSRSAAIEVTGPPDNPASLVEPVIRWAQDCAGEPA